MIDERKICVEKETERFVARVLVVSTSNQPSIDQSMSSIIWPICGYEFLNELFVFLDARQRSSDETWDN